VYVVPDTLQRATSRCPQAPGCAVREGDVQALPSTLVFAVVLAQPSAACAVRRPLNLYLGLLCVKATALVGGCPPLLPTRSPVCLVSQTRCSSPAGTSILTQRLVRNAERPLHQVCCRVNTSHENDGCLKNCAKLNWFN